MLRLGQCVLIAGALSLFNGCQYVGPIAIDQGRDRYNHTIESTAKEQTFANILRVYHHEPTLFMDVTEVDATTTMSGAASGAITNIGAKAGTSGGTLAGQTGGFATGVTYSESPLIRYQPLLGQALVVQLATPVSPDALASLYDSGWGVAPLLALAASFLALDVDESYAALNTIAALDEDQAVELVAGKSDVTKAKDSTTTGTIHPGVTLEVTNKASGAGGTDALVIYFLPFHPHALPKELSKEMDEYELWNRLLRLYAGTQSKKSKCPSTTRFVNLREKPACRSIELRTMPVTADNMRQQSLLSGAPLMKTYSALGILKNAVEQPLPRIGVVSPAVYFNIRNRPWNDPAGENSDLTFYTLMPCYEGNFSMECDELPGDERPAKTQYDATINKAITDTVIDWLKKHSDDPVLYLPKRDDTLGDDFVRVNKRLGDLRRYILIVHSNNAPANAYVAHFDHGEWYYIDADDTISQKNFDLVSLFLTMMAVPSATPPIAPVISTGGG